MQFYVHAYCWVFTAVINVKVFYCITIIPLIQRMCELLITGGSEYQEGQVAN